MSPVDRKTLKVLHVVHSLNNRMGGAVHAALGICKFLALAGNSIEIAATELPSDDTDYLKRDFKEVGCRTFPRSFPARFFNSASLGEWVASRLHAVDIVDIHTVFSGTTIQAALACIRAGKPYIVRPHGSLDPFDLRKKAWLKRIVGPLVVRPVLRRSTAVILTASLEAERLETYGAKVNKVVCPLPVVLPERRGDRAAFRRKHAIPADAQAVLFLSRIDYKKGLEMLIPALGKLKGVLPNLWFILAGDGESAFVSRVDGWLVEHGVQATTRKVGFISGTEKSDAMAAADVFALPSHNENFGIVNIEAMHAGLPLLISDEVYLYPEIVSAGAGVVCERNVTSIVEKLRFMFSESCNLKEMGEAGADLVRRRYRPEVATEHLMGIYRQVLYGHGF